MKEHLYARPRKTYVVTFHAANGSGKRFLHYVKAINLKSARKQTETAMAKRGSGFFGGIVIDKISSAADKYV